MLLLHLTYKARSGVITNLTSGASIDFKVNNLGTQANVIRIDLTEKVGINTLSSAEALDVAGSNTSKYKSYYPKVLQIVQVLVQVQLR